MRRWRRGSDASKNGWTLLRARCGSGLFSSCKAIGGSDLASGIEQAGIRTAGITDGHAVIP